MCTERCAIKRQHSTVTYKKKRQALTLNAALQQHITEIQKALQGCKLVRTKIEQENCENKKKSPSFYTGVFHISGNVNKQHIILKLHFQGIVDDLSSY